ncbi:MAG TPA: DUF4373 domain-containing protein [Bacteroidia bacterium]|nr:DUF4373 domain-containing protein [Bacteroidia bacterium]
MARPVKQGLSYFPKDTDFYSNREIRRVAKEHGLKGIIVFDYMLCLIYNDKGYYIDYNEELVFDVADFLKTYEITEENVDNVVKSCLKHSLFNNGMFENRKILTSAGIQSRYINAKRKDVIDEKYRVIMQEPIVNSRKPIVNSQEPPINVEESTQSKVKYSKVNESKVNYYFKIKGSIITNIFISSYLEEHYPILIEQYCMKNDSGKKFYSEVMEKLNTECVGYNFADDNHVQNMFKSNYEKLIKNGNNKKHSGVNQNIKQGAGFGNL